MDKKEKVIVPIRHQKNEKLSLRLADYVTAKIGTTNFLLAQLGFFLAWIIINTLTLLGYVHFDPYPYILLNLVVGVESACTGPLVMMSQNRQELKDRLMAEQTFEDTENLKNTVESLKTLSEKNHQETLQHIQEIYSYLRSDTYHDRLSY